MADSNKSTIVIASVLKPVDDSRMYEKIAATLAGSGKYNVHVIGIDSARIETPGVTQYPLKPFKRISIARLFAPWRIMTIAFRIRPQILMITTHELLYVALLLKAVRRCKIIYDVRENYYWNILYTPAFPLVLKPFVALYVRGKEALAAPYIDHFLLAERGYEQELKFPRRKYTIIENKVRIDVPPERAPLAAGQKTIGLLFSGTIAESTGVFTAIDLAIKLHVIDDRIRLTIIGFCSQEYILHRVRLLIQPRPFIQLITGEAPVPHLDIFKHIRSADFGMVTYQVTPSTMNSIPTKLYEYLGFRLPILLVNHRPWVDFCYSYSAAVVFDPAHYDAADILNSMLTQRFYLSPPENVSWSSEAPKLLGVLEALN